MNIIYSCGGLCLLTFPLFVTSCRQDVDYSVGSPNAAPASESVLQERLVPVPQLPKSYLRKYDRLRALSIDAPDLKLYPYNTLGAVCRIGNGFIGHPMNVGNTGVIDIQSILNDRLTSKFLFNRPMETTTSTLDIYHNQDNLVNVTNKTKKITAGFTLNLGVFSLGKKTTYNKIFHSTLTENNSHSWAELNLLYYANRIGIETTDASLKSIASRNMDDLFLYSIYSYPIENYVKEKGFLVVGNFFTGGRLTAMLDYSDNVKSKTDIDYESVDVTLKASFGWGKQNDGKKEGQGMDNKEGVDKPQGDFPAVSPSASLYKNNASMSIGFGRGNSTLNSSGSKNEKLYAHIQVYGGSKNDQIPSAPLDLRNNTINIGSWYSSLSDSKTHQYVDVDDGGLISIDKFMLEENFRERVRGVLEGTLPSKHKLDVPYIEFKRIVYVVGKKEPYLYGTRPRSEDVYSYINLWAPVLHTRQGDKIALLTNYEKIVTRDDVSRAPSSSLVERVGRVFGCEIKKVGVNDLDYHLLRDVLKMEIPINLDGDKIYKFRNPRTNIWYIYDMESRSAFSYYDSPDDDDDDTYVTDLYGITEWVDTLKERKVSMQDLSTNYKIVGL